MKRFNISLARTLVVVGFGAMIGACAVQPVAQRAVIERDAANADTGAPLFRQIEGARAPSGEFGAVQGNAVPHRVIEPAVQYDEGLRPRGEAPIVAPPVSPKRPTPPQGGMRGIGRFVGFDENPAKSEAVATEPASTQAFDSSFSGSDYDNNVAVTGGGAFIPPDNHIAVGPDHIVTVTNVAIQIHTKAASPARVLNQSLRTFFTNAGVTPANATFDPKVLYDNQSGRFVVMTMELVDQGAGSGTSRLLVAASQGSNPTTGTWRTLAINGNINVGGNNFWADFPGFAVDEEAIYISANMFRYPSVAPPPANPYLGSRLWVIPKTPFYAASPVSVSLIDLYANLTPGAATSLAARLVGTPAGATGTWFVSAGWSGATTDFLRVVRIDSALSATPTVNSQFIDIGNVHDQSQPLALAPQLGDPGPPTLSAGDPRAHDAQWRDNSLYLTHTVRPPGGSDANQSTLRWVRINTSNPGALTLADQGAIGGETIAPGTHTFYGNIGVNAAGAAVIGFSASSATTRPGAYYAIRLASDAAGTTQTPVLLRAGTAYYFRDFDSGTNRWGDYSGSSVDEATGCVWVYNQHSVAPSTSANGGTGRWATFGGRVCPSGSGVELVFRDGFEVVAP